MDIKYISSEEKPAAIMTNNCSKDDHVKHMKSTKEVEQWDIV